MTEIQSLSDNDTIWQQFLPSVGAGYRQTFSKFQDGQLEKILSSLLQIGHDIPEEKANKISNDFFNSSLHDFCTKYLISTPICKRSGIFIFPQRHKCVECFFIGTVIK